MAVLTFRRLSLFGVSLLVAALVSLASPARAQAQAKSLYQLQSEHVDLRFGMFIHFNMNTYFPGWGNARTDPKSFNPTSLNTNQWATAAKSAKMTYAVLTTKHHDGFSIWPSKQTPPNGKTAYTIAQSSTPTRDVVKEYVDSFRAQGILPGLYFSMWDTANIGGTYDAPGYTDNGTISWSKVKAFILGQITELLDGTYGEIPIFVIDGWSWSMGHRYAPYQEIRALVKRLQPNCLLVDHNGAMPWEVDIMYFEEPLKIQAPAGNTIAACQGQTISGDWFWDSSAASSGSLMTTADIVSHINRLQPLYTNFLLNCPPNRQGVFDQAIVDRLGQVGTMWSVASRAALPTQAPAIEYPITGVTATATSASGSAINAIDSTNDYTEGPRHQTLWQSSGALPQSVTVDLGATYNGIDILRYVPNRDNATGAITSYRVLGSVDGTTFTQVASGTWAANSSIKSALFTATSARYMRLEAVAVNGGSSATVGEVAVGGNATPVSTGALGTGGSGAGGAASGGRGGAGGATGGAGGSGGNGGSSGGTGGGGGPATGGSSTGGSGGSATGGTGPGSGGSTTASGGAQGQTGGTTASGGTSGGSGGSSASGGSGSGTDGGAKGGTGGTQTSSGSAGCGCAVSAGVAGNWASFALAAMALAGAAGRRGKRRRREEDCQPPLPGRGPTSR